MKNYTSILLTFLFLASFGWAGAQETTLKVASDRTAVLHVTNKNPADPEVSGTAKGTADLKTGKSAFSADLTLLKAAELQGATASLFTQMTGKTIEAIGFVNAKLPDDPNGPKVLTVKAETVTDGDQSAANFDLKILVPSKGEPVPKGSGDFKFEGDFKALKSSGNFAFSGEQVKSEDIPFKNFSLDITELENKTTISFEIKMPKASDMAAQLDSLPQMAPMLEGQLKQAGVKYEGVEFPAPTEEGDLKVGKGKITLIDLRGTIRPFMGMAAMQMQAEMGPDVDVKTAMENIIEVKFEKLSFQMNVAEKAIDGNFEVNVNTLDKFYQGYMVLLPAIQKQQNQQLAREAGEFGPLIAAFMELNSEQAAAAIKAAVESEMKLNGEMKFALDSKVTDSKETDVDLSASGSFGATNFQDYVAKAKAAGLPVAEKAVGQLELELKDKTNLVGDMYFYTDGDLISYYKGMLSKAAASAQSPPEVVEAINKLEINKMVMKMSLQDNKVTVLGSSDTSDLTAITKLVIKQAAPQVEAILTAASFDVDMPQGAAGNADMKAFFSDFMPGKNEAQIKEALGLPSSAKVSMDGTAEDMKLVALELPEIAIDGKLSEVQAEGQKLMASSPSDIAAGSSGGGGGNKWGLIALGLLLVVGVGGFMMFGKKS